MGDLIQHKGVAGAVALLWTFNGNNDFVYFVYVE